MTVRLHTASGTLTLGDPPAEGPTCEVCWAATAAMTVGDLQQVHVCAACGELAILLFAGGAHE